MKKILPLIAILFAWLTAWNVQAQEPVPNTYSPVKDATGVALDVTLELTFDIEIAFNSTGDWKEVSVKEVSSGSKIYTNLVASGSPFQGGLSISADERTLQIDLSSSDVSPETEYAVVIESGVVENKIDNTPFSGIDDSAGNQWRFTTLERPSLISRSPAHDATGVTGLQALVLTYGEEVSAGSNKNLYIHKSDGSLFQTINTTDDAGLITFDPTSSEVTLQHDAFNGSRDFHVLMDEGFMVSTSTGVGSAAVTSDTYWNFTTAAGPAIATLSPAGTPGGTNGDQSLIISYDEGVSLQSGKNINIHHGDGTLFQTISSDNSLLVAFDSGTNELTVNHDRFPGNSTFYVNTDEGLVLADDNNIAADAITGSSAWSFSTPPPPGMTFVAPANSAIEVTANEPLIIAFDETVSLQSDKNVVIYKSDDTPFQTINTASNPGLFSFNATSDTLAISHDPFNGGQTYYVNIEEELVVSDATAIGSSAVTGSSTWSFTTTDAPAISSFQPDGEINVQGNQVLELNYTENIIPGDNKNLYIYRQSDDLLFQTINTTTDAGMFTAVDTSLQISHDPLWANTTFYILADEGVAVSGSSGIPAEGISNTARWTFTTGSGPVAETYIPPATSTGISVSSPFMVVFNENIARGASGSVTIHLSSDESVVESIPFDSEQLAFSNDTLTINHSGLSPETGYYINIENEVVVSASTGTTWDGINDQSWNFTTGGAPSITGYNPVQDETSAPVNQTFALTFDTNIKRGNAGYIKIREEGDQYFQDIPFDAGRLTFNANELQIAHDVLNASTTYFVKIDNDVIRSLDTDVSFPGITDTTRWRFTTAEPPGIDSFTPPDGSTLASAGENLTVSFDQDIVLGSSRSFRIRYANSGNARFHTVSTDDTEYISITDSVLTISHPKFEPDTSYFVLVEDGFVISETSGIAFPGIQDSTRWGFSAPSGPAIETYEPANNSVDIAVDSTLTLTFNENIARGSGNLVIQKQSDGADVITISASSSNLTFINNTLSINNLTMPHETTLYITTDEGFVQSAGTGFDFSGITDTTEWVFTTLPEPPAWISEYPAFQSITPDNIDLALMTNRDANYYFVITSNSVSPSATQISEGKNSGGSPALISGDGPLTANTEWIHSNINISGLPSENHWLHAVAKDPGKEIFSGVATLQIDKVPPVTTIFPPDGTTHFPEDGILSASFDERVYTASGTAIDDTNVSNYVNLTLTSDGSTIDCSVVINTEGREVTVTPGSNLDPATSYTLAVSEVYDEIGNGQTAASVSTFTTDKLNIWTGNGADPSDWSDSGNWSTGSFTDNTSIEIPASAATFPEAAGTVNVYNINLEPGASLLHTSGTLTVNGAFRMQSATTGNASYINTGGTLGVSPDSVKIEQHVTGTDYVYNISSPVSGATKSNSGIDNLMYSFNNATGQWVEAGDSETMTTGTGYSAKSSRSLVFSGNITTGAINLELHRSTAGLGWNLVGNPYTASIDWTSTELTKDNIVDAFWIYLNDQGSYGAYNDTTGMAINLDGPEIPSNHAFWVKVNEGLETDTGSLTLSPGALTANSGSYLKSAKRAKYPGFKLMGGSPGGTDETAVAFIPGAETGEDIFDTEKMNSNNKDLLQLFTLDSESQKLCINGLPELATDSIALGFNAGRPGTFSVQMSADYLEAGQELMLIDNETGGDINLSEGDYQFDVSNKGINSERFFLKVVQKATTPVIAPKEDKSRCKVYTRHRHIFIETPDIHNIRFSMSDIKGRTIGNGTMDPETRHRLDTPRPGIYILNIIADEGTEVHKVIIE